MCVNGSHIQKEKVADSKIFPHWGKRGGGGGGADNNFGIAQCKSPCSFLVKVGSSGNC